MTQHPEPIPQGRQTRSAHTCRYSRKIYTGHSSQFCLKGKITDIFFQKFRTKITHFMLHVQVPTFKKQKEPLIQHYKELVVGLVRVVEQSRAPPQFWPPNRPSPRASITSPNTAAESESCTSSRLDPGNGAPDYPKIC